MAKRIYPSNDAEFAVWLANLVNKANTYKAELKLTGDQLDALHSKLNSFNGNVALKQQKREEAAAQVALVKNERIDLNRDVGLLNNAAKSIDGLPVNILAELGLSADEENFGATAPVSPAALVVTGTSDGINQLKWRRSSNRHSTLFIIEAKAGEQGDWMIVDVVTGTKFRHRNQTPGIKMQYRVKAKRGDFESGYTNTAVVYG